MISPEKLQAHIKLCLENFYDARFKKLKELKLEKILKAKNPYLYRAFGIGKASELIEQMMIASLISGDESRFGNLFFEPVLRFVSGAKDSDAEGVDFTVETKTRFLAIALKSGSNWGNADQHKRQSTNFDAMRKRLQKLNKNFDPLCGQSYGQQQSDPTESARFRRLSGQAFWEVITSDKDFYLKLIRLMKSVPEEHHQIFKTEWEKTLNLFTQEFTNNFCTHGAIDWEKLVRFNSGKKPTKQ